MAQENKGQKKTPFAGYLVGIGFLITAGVLIATDRKVDIPMGETPRFNIAQIATVARRVPLSDPPTIDTGTFVQRCSDCHSLFENIREPDRALTQHIEIKLNHGANDHCLSCHDIDNREMLTLRGGGTIGFNQVEQLCAQCHGPIYNDWKKGTHGKTVGYWNTDLGMATKLTCSQCHDPHSPAYEPISPLPGPNTLRMGKPHSVLDAINMKNPLQRWRQPDKKEGDH